MTCPCGKRPNKFTVEESMCGMCKKTYDRAGWRHFKCEECGRLWKETSRDRFSPSGVDCGCCGEWVSPCSNSTKPKVSVDDMGNTLMFECIIIQEGTERE